ncbi:MAG: aldehyde ferredoxin oxidoreductase N-terminal domain-containing protein [Pseudomonadota bacterium]
MPIGHGGYLGRILYVDLSNGNMKEEAPDEMLLKDFIGGYGLGARIIYSRQKANVDPMGPENLFGILTGPLSGTPAIIQRNRLKEVIDYEIGK